MAGYCGDNMRDFFMTDNQSKTCLEIFYQNVRGLRTKQTELFDNVCSVDFQIICLTEIWLNDMCFDHKLFPDSCTIFRSDRVSSTKSRGGGVLTAVSSRVRSFKRRYDLQFYEECVWFEISTQNGRSLLIGNHYFPPDIKSEIMPKYLCSLEKTLDNRNHYVLLIGDFNVPNFDWQRGLPYQIVIFIPN
jgi:exonuclease III